MPIWKKTITPEELQEISRNTLVEHLGIRFLEIGDDYLRGSMPVDKRTIQAYGLLHGGASVTLAETLGSWGAVLTLGEGEHCFGIAINANHVRAVRQGQVFATARPLRRGRSTQVWEIWIEDEEDRLVSTARLTLLVVRQDR